MQYLTRTEQRRAGAQKNWPLRKLTVLEEKLLKELTVLPALPHNTQKEKQIKDEMVKTVVNELLQMTGTDTLGNKVALAAYQPAALSSLLEGYPYVEFNGILNGDEKLTPIEQYAREGFNIDHLRDMLEWVVKLHALFAELPKGLDTYIATPTTDYATLRDLATSTKEAKYHGYTLPPETQAKVDGLFYDNSWRDKNMYNMFHLRNFGLLEIPDIWKRAKLTDRSETCLNKGLKIVFNTVTPGNFIYIHELLMIEESTNTRLHFCITG